MKVRAGLHEAADVDVALGDDAVERRDHALIGLLLVSTRIRASCAAMFACATADRRLLGFEVSRSVSPC